MELTIFCLSTKVDFACSSFWGKSRSSVFSVSKIISSSNSCVRRFSRRNNLDESLESTSKGYAEFGFNSSGCLEPIFFMLSCNLFNLLDKLFDSFCAIFNSVNVEKLIRFSFIVLFEVFEACSTIKFLRQKILVLLYFDHPKYQ